MDKRFSDGSLLPIRPFRIRNTPMAKRIADADAWMVFVETNNFTRIMERLAELGNAYEIRIGRRPEPSERPG